jgi:lipid IVA palmitoyltransferase
MNDQTTGFRPLRGIRMAGACGLIAMAAAASASDAAAPSGAWYERAAQRLETTWKDGQTELYLPLDIYHMHFAYAEDKLKRFNRSPYGLGLGKGALDEHGDWHGLYVMGFQDSHFKPEYVAGYGYKTYLRLAGQLKLGLGYTVFVTTRADLGHYTPIPAVLPLVSLDYGNYSLESTYIPGGHGYGNVLFFWGKVRF